jgi:BASS family bile acid:Na+ symporter
MNTQLDLGVVAVTVLMMLAVGLELDLAAFRRLVTCPRRLAVAAIVQWIALPLLAWAVAELLGLPSHLAAALLLLSACPVGDIANYYTLLARGNLAASIALNAATCLLAPVTMAATLAVFRWLGHDEDLFAVPGSLLVLRLVGIVVVPLAAGLAIRRLAPRWSARISPLIQKLAGLGILVLVVLVIATQHRQLARDLWPALAASLSFILGSLVLGGVFLAGGRHCRAEMTAVALCVPTRNIGLACAVAIGLAGRPDYAAFAVTYFLVEAPLLVLLALAPGFRLPSVDAPD